MDYKLVEQRSLTKFLLLEGEKPCHIFQRLQKFFSKVCKSRITFYSWVSKFREDRASVRDKHTYRLGRPAEAVIPTMVAKKFCQQRSQSDIAGGS